MEKSLKGVPVEGFTKKSRQAAAEGIVLLKNEDNILPFTKEERRNVTTYTGRQNFSIRSTTD